MAVVAAAFLCFGSDASAQKTTKLFNGKDLSGWNFVVDKNSVPAEQVFSVKDGVINITGQPFGYMYTKEKYGDISFIPFTGRLLAVLIRLLDFRERGAGLAWLILVFSQIRTAEQDEITGIIKHQVAFDTVRKRVFRLFN